MPYTSANIARWHKAFTLSAYCNHRCHRKVLSNLVPNVQIKVRIEEGVLLPFAVFLFGRFRYTKLSTSDTDAVRIHGFWVVVRDREGQTQMNNVLIILLLLCLLLYLDRIQLLKLDDGFKTAAARFPLFSIA
jgi:hypothetical protein